MYLAISPILLVIYVTELVISLIPIKISLNKLKISLIGLNVKMACHTGRSSLCPPLQLWLTTGGRQVFRDSRPRTTSGRAAVLSRTQPGYTKLKRPWYVQPCLCDWAYKRSRATYRKEKGIVSRWSVSS